MKRFAFLAIAVALVGCGTTDPTTPEASGFRDPSTAPYRSMQTDAGYRLVPAGKVRWDTSWVAGTNIYDSARETLAEVGAMWVDTNWGAYNGGGQDIPVWRVFLIANEKSRARGLDTVYQWTSLDTSRHDWTDSMLGFHVREANGYRLPTTKEAKYLVWAGDTTRWAWGDQDAMTWARMSLWGDSASTVRNKFGVVMHRTLARGGFLAADGFWCTNVILPLFTEWQGWNASSSLLEDRWGGRAPIFVRSAD